MRIEQLSTQEQETIQNELDQWLDKDKVQVISKEELLKMRRESRGY